MRSGSQARTSGGIAGCITATPKPVSTEAAYKRPTSGAAPRNADPAAVISSPAITVAKAPSRAMNSEPGTAATANRITGRPARMPTSVSLMPRSSWMRGINGGTAKMVMRRPLPASQSSATQVITCLLDRWVERVAGSGAGRGVSGCGECMWSPATLEVNAPRLHAAPVAPCVYQRI